jgi:hypothetical protein
MARVKECIATSNSRGQLEEALIASYDTYARSTAYVWHCANQGILADGKIIAAWVEKDDALTNQLTVLSGGVNRERLKFFLGTTYETREMPREIAGMTESS